MTQVRPRSEAALELGRRIRRLRSEAGMTLVEAAGRAGISQPFLSQVERGYANPSMATLQALARVLGTTQARLLTSEHPSGDRECVLVRADEGRRLPRGAEADPRSHTRIVTDAPGLPQVMEYREFPAGLGEYFSHPEPEWLYVVSGRVEVDLEGSGLSELGAGDSISYPGGVGHRWRALDDEAVLVVVKPT